MERIKRLIFLILVLGSTLSSAQSPYQFNWKKEGVIGAIGISSWGGSYLFEKQASTFSSEQLLDLSRARVNSFDRTATYNYSLSAQQTSDWLSMGSKMLPLVFLLDKKPRNDFGTIAALYAETYIVANGLTVLAKSAIQRPRPYVYNEVVGLDEKQTASARHSFISGHTSKTAAMTFFTAKVYSDYHPDSKWKPVIWVAAATVPAVTGYMRVEAGKHFPTDVITGYAVGALTGILVPQLHKNLRIKKNENLKVNLGVTGGSLNLTF